MAKNKDNLILQGTSGQIGKQIVIKQYNFGTVITKYPNMDNIKPSEKQQKVTSWFAKAVSFAKAINNNPTEKQKWLHLVSNGSNVYQTALKWYLKNYKI